MILCLCLSHETRYQALLFSCVGWKLGSLGKRLLLTNSLTPCFRQELPNRSGPHFREEGTTMDGTEMRQIAKKVELLCYHCESSLLSYDVNAESKIGIVQPHWQLRDSYTYIYTHVKDSAHSGRGWSATQPSFTTTQVLLIMHHSQYSSGIGTLNALCLQ